MYTQETLFDSFIIDSDLDLFSLTNYLMRMMQTVLRQRVDQLSWEREFVNLKTQCKIIKINVD